MIFLRRLVPFSFSPRISSLISPFSTMSSASFDVSKFKKLLNTSHVGRQFIYEEKVESTMQIGEEIIKTANNPELVHGYSVLGEEQTKGRGRRGRSWKSSASGNIYFTFVWTKNVTQSTDMKFFEEAKKLNVAVSVATVHACGENVSCGVKWPNDVWTNDGKKLSGMIVNVFPKQGCVVGLGINVNEIFEHGVSITDDAKTATSVIPSSIAMETGGEVCRESVLATFCNHLERLMSLTFSEILDEYNDMDIMKRQSVHVYQKSVGEEEDGDYDAEACGILPDGSYQVKKLGSGDTVNLQVEEVSIRPST
eukprot:m.10738 g.10738  ORF g.10738 m.10738 type:complete len:309 (-) comp3720_c1_seq1:1359-2285(-)